MFLKVFIFMLLVELFLELAMEMEAWKSHFKMGL